MRKPAYQTLVDFWQRPGSMISHSRTSEMAIQTLEKKYSLQLPEQFRDYLKEATPEGEFFDDDGTSCHPFDEHYTTWWSLADLKSIPEEYEEYEDWETGFTNKEILDDAHLFLFFADHSIWCWAWAICCKPGENYGRIIQVDKTERFVADNFDIFVEKYVTLNMVYFD